LDPYDVTSDGSKEGSFGKQREEKNMKERGCSFGF
jgi:hypothetical protein